jgi:glycosyltransferase involved in cell wall biosynthesis
VIVAMDIPHQGKFIQLVRSLGMKYIAITPLENPPLTMSWANILAPADKVFFISELGASEARLSGLEDAEHLIVGMDTESWRGRTPEEYTQGREYMNISPDTLVVMSVADNQERKNLSKAFEIVGKLKREKGLKVKYLLVTAEHSPVGWNLRDLAMTYGIASELTLFEREIPFKELYSLYAISDVYLLTSKAEGLGMPVMEAMSIGVPVVATNCGAMPELLRDEFGNDRGLLMETEYDMIDPWGNSRRDFPDADSGVALIERVNRGKDGTGNPSLMTRSARQYMESRTWESPIEQVSVALEKLYEQE